MKIPVQVGFRQYELREATEAELADYRSREQEAYQFAREMFKRVQNESPKRKARKAFFWAIVAGDLLLHLWEFRHMIR